MKYVYLLTITDNEPNEYSKQKLHTSVYVDEGLARHYMFRDIMEQFEKGRIESLNGLDNKMSYYNNGGIKWKIEKVIFVDGIK